MTFKEAIKKVETHEFVAYLNVASDFTTFLQAMQQQEAVSVLLEALDNQANRLYIFKRIFELSKEKVDLRYENKWDTALTVYVWLINFKHRKLAKIVAETAINAPQCWWANKLSRQILDSKQLYTDANFNEQLIGEKEVSSASDALKEAEEILLTTFIRDDVILSGGEFNIETELSGPVNSSSNPLIGYLNATSAFYPLDYESTNSNPNLLVTT